jgi:hypothetical protein
MDRKPPARLYKYQPFSARTLTALKTRTVWFGRPSGLNDPFDCDVPTRFSEISVDDCARLLKSKEGAHWGPIHTDPRCIDSSGSPTEFLRSSLQRSGENTLRDHARESYSSRGVTCFSETPDSTLLWSHYGGAHRGICLEFDTSSPWLDKLHKVRYTDEIPEINIVDVLTGDTSRVLWTLLTKASCWQYESEWRAIHKEADTLYCYGIEALTGVYLGAKLSDSEKDLVAHVVHGSNTQLHAMTRSPTSFRLEAGPVQYTPFRYPEPKQSNER